MAERGFCYFWYVLKEVEILTDIARSVGTEFSGNLVGDAARKCYREVRILNTSNARLPLPATALTCARSREALLHMPKKAGTPR